MIKAFWVGGEGHMGLLFCFYSSQHKWRWEHSVESDFFCFFPFIYDMYFLISSLRFSSWRFCIRAYATLV